MTQPDQDATRWDAHVDAYERVFEPLTDAFNARALEMLPLQRGGGTLEGMDLLDVAAGAGGAALAAAARGARVTAVDASAAMVARIAARGPGRITSHVADAASLPFPNASFDAVLSSFGVVLMPDPAAGMAEMHRVLRPGGRAAVVTWTEPHRYELAVRLRDAATTVRGPAALSGELPVQLRFTDPSRLRWLLAEAGFAVVKYKRLKGVLWASSPAALAASLGFAPGMTAMLDALGADRDAVTQRFQAALEAERGTGALALGAVAHIAVGKRT